MKWKIYDNFHVSVLKQNTNKKERLVKNAAIQLEFKAANNEEYEMERIWDSVLYAIESEVGHLPGLYYLVLWKDYPKEESMWKPALAMYHLWKLLNKFHQENSTKPTAISPLFNFALPMTKSTVKSMATKQKQGRLAKNSTNKRAKNI